MGTRSLICVYYKGDFVVALYTQYDGFPEGQGADIVEFLKSPQRVESLRTGLEYINEISENEYRDFARQGESYTPPSLSCLTGANILNLIADANADNRIPIFKELSFANNDISCEYAYVVDLDKNVLEAFGTSVSKSASTSQRFANVGTRKDTVPRLLKSFDLADLPSPKGFARQVKEIYARYEED